MSGLSGEIRYAILEIQADFHSGIETFGSDFVGSNPAEFFVEVQGDQFEVTDLGGM